MGKYEDYLLSNVDAARARLIEAKERLDAAAVEHRNATEEFDRAVEDLNFKVREFLGTHINPHVVIFDDVTGD